MGLPERLTARAIWILFLVLFVFQLASFWLSTPPHLVTRFADDAYFYFKIARNIVESGKASFDGATLTNGFHPLWMGLLLPVFALVKDPLLVLRIVGTLNVVLLGLACLLSLRYLMSRFPLLSFAFAAVILVKYFLAFVGYSMETSLVLPLCILAVALAEGIDLRSVSGSSGKRILALGVTMAALQLARLDAVFLNLAIVVGVALVGVRGRRLRESVRGLSLLIAPSLVTGTVYMAVNYSVFGHVMPVSGAAKSLGAGHMNSRMVAQLARVPSLGELASMWTVFSVMILACLGYVMAVLAKPIRVTDRPPGIAELVGPRRAALITSAFCLGFVLYYFFLSSWALWGWYAYPGFLVAVFVVPGIFSMAERPLFRAWGKVGFVRLARVAAVVALIAVAFSAARGSRWNFWRDTDLARDFTYQNYVLAKSLNDRYASPPKVAMGDRAGSFGYFYKGSVLQLEGLVGDYHLLDAIRSNSLSEYVSASDVEYVIAYNGPVTGYGEWTLLVPTPEFSAGPYAEVKLCEGTETMRLDTGAGIICIWKWPSCRR